MKTIGKFIVFEGIDGAGKSTQVEMLSSHLRKLGHSVMLTAEPTSLESGKAIRRALSGEESRSEEEMAAMFALDRIAHNRELASTLAEGTHIICDRYYYSSLAYQGQATDYSWVKAMNIDCPAIRRPDICIYLDLTPEQSLERIKARNGELEIYENIEKLTGVRRAFLSVIEDLRAEGEHILVIDASLSSEQISKSIFEIIEKILL